MAVKRELISGLLIGGDIEWFLQNEETGEIVSAENIIQGTKYEPFHFDPTNNYYATSLDNVMAEGNIPPIDNPVDLFFAIEKLRKYIDTTVANQGLKTVAIPSARLDEKWLQTENARVFGCAPSLNCWTGEFVYPEPKGDNLRCAGAHWHFGYDNPSEETNLLIGRAFDLVLGIPSILIEPKNERKAVGYGQAGNIRHQRHGMEARLLSSYFTSSKDLIEWCYRNCMNVVDFVNNNRSEEIANRGDEIQRIINSENKKDAEKLVKEFNLELI